MYPMKTWQQFSSSRDYLMNTGIFQFTQFPLIPHKAAINCQFNLNPAQIMPYHFFYFQTSNAIPRFILDIVLETELHFTKNTTQNVK